MNTSNYISYFHGLRLFNQKTRVTNSTINQNLVLKFSFLGGSQEKGCSILVKYLCKLGLKDGTALGVGAEIE